MAGEVMLVVDDHPLFRAALKVAAVRAVPDATILEAGTIADGVALLRAATRIDLVLLDLRMPDAEGYSGIAAIHVEAPEVPIIVVSGEQEQQRRAEVDRQVIPAAPRRRSDRAEEGPRRAINRSDKA